MLSLSQQERECGRIDAAPIATARLISLRIEFIRPAQVLTCLGAIPFFTGEILVGAGEQAKSFLIPVPVLIQMLKHLVGGPGRTTPGQGQRQKLTQTQVLRKRLHALSDHVVGHQWFAQLQYSFAE